MASIAPTEISGSGLGDCAIGLGKVSAFAKGAADRLPFGNFPTYPLNVSTQGVQLGF